MTFKETRHHCFWDLDKAQSSFKTEGDSFDSHSVQHKVEHCKFCHRTRVTHTDRTIELEEPVSAI